MGNKKYTRSINNEGLVPYTIQGLLHYISKSLAIKIPRKKYRDNPENKWIEKSDQLNQEDFIYVSPSKLNSELHKLHTF